MKKFLYALLLLVGISSCTKDDEANPESVDYSNGMLFFVPTSTDQRLHFLSSELEQMQYSIYASVNDELLGFANYYSDRYVLDIIKDDQYLYVLTNQDSVKVIDARTMRLERQSLKLDHEFGEVSTLRVNNNYICLVKDQEILLLNKEDAGFLKSIAIANNNFYDSFLSSDFFYFIEKENNRLSGVSLETEEKVNFADLGEVMGIKQNKNKLYVLSTGKKVFVINMNTAQVEETIPFNKADQISGIFDIDQDKIYIHTENGKLYAHTKGESGFHVEVEDIEMPTIIGSSFFVKDDKVFYIELLNYENLKVYDITGDTLKTFYLNDFPTTKMIYND